MFIPAFKKSIYLYVYLFLTIWDWYPVHPAGVDSSYASRRESLSSEMAGLAAPDDSRVLTLAEQIIAALPERIKVWSAFLLLY